MQNYDHYRYKLAYKIKPLKLGNNRRTIVLRSINYGLYIVSNVLTLGGLISITGAIPAPLGVILITSGKTIDFLAQRLRDSSEEMLKLADIEYLLSKQDIRVLKHMASKINNISDLLDRYKRWEDIPPDDKNLFADYLDEMYLSMGDLKNALNKAKRETEGAR